MSDAPELAALSALPRVDPDSDARLASLCRLLTAAGVAAHVEAQPMEGAWFAAADGVRFRVDRIDEQHVVLAPDRVGEAVAALDAADPLLRAAEGALGIALEPDALDLCDGEAGAVLAIAQAGCSAQLQVPEDHPATARWLAEAAALAPASSAVPMLFALHLRGPRLSIAEAEALGPGDLLLLPASAPAALHPIGGATLPGVMALARGDFTVTVEGETMADRHAPSEFAVPLEIRLPERMTSAATLAALVPGTTLLLGPLTEGMAVDLLVGGRLLARGELVQLGDRFAVLVEERPSLDDPVIPAAAEPAAAPAEEQA